MTPPPKYKEQLITFIGFQSELEGVGTKAFNKYYTQGLIKRSKLYFHVVKPDQTEVRGYLYYPLSIAQDDEAFKQWLKVNVPEWHKALLLLLKRGVMTQDEVKKAGWTDTATLSTISAHSYLGLKRRWLGNGKPIVYYTLSEDELNKWISDKLVDYLYAKKAKYVREAYHFQNVLLPQVIKKELGQVPVATEVFKKTDSGETFKFDAVALKRFKFLGKNRSMPVVFEAKNFFLGTSRKPAVTWFKYKLDRAYPTGYMAILVCMGACKEMYDFCGRNNIWLRDVRKEIKTLNESKIVSV